MRLIRWFSLLIAFLAMLVSSSMVSASSRAGDHNVAANHNAAMLATEVPAHWELVDVTTRDTFFADWAPGSTWSPTFGGSSSGGTIVDKNGADSVRVETSCSWSVGGDTQRLFAGQALQVSLTINTTATGLTAAANLASGDSVVVYGLGGDFVQARDEYAVSSLNTDSAQGSGSGSLAIPAGSSGQTKTIEFRCLVDAGMGTAYTDLELCLGGRAHANPQPDTLNITDHNRYTDHHPNPDDNRNPHHHADTYGNTHTHAHTQPG